MSDERFSEGWDLHGEIIVGYTHYHVRMTHRLGPFRAVVEVWQDVWPAVGGLILRRRFYSNDKARAFFDEMHAALCGMDD